MTALQAALPLLTELRQALGQHGELSGQEAETRRRSPPSGLSP